MAFFEDPASGRRAGVNKDKRVAVTSVQRSEELSVTAKGHGYNINTGYIPLTTSTESGLLYFENNEDHPIVIAAIAAGFDNLGTHVGSPIMTIVRNPTSVSFSTAVDINCNRNFASSNTLKSTTLAYKGAEGATITGGEDCLLIQAGTGGRLFATINLELGIGNSIGVKIDPQVTSGTASIYTALIIYTSENLDG